MKVNSIDNTRFGALKINPKLRSDIARRGSDFLVALNNYGKEIDDIKLYNVVLDDSIHNPKIFGSDKNATRDFFSELKSEEKKLGKCYEIPDGFDGDTRGGFFPDEPRVFRKLYGENAKSKYAEFKKLDIYEQAAHYSRMLEECDIKRMTAEAVEKSKKLVEEIQKKEQEKKLYQEVDDIIARYGYEEPLTSAETTQKQTAKKSWWQRIFS